MMEIEDALSLDILRLITSISKSWFREGEKKIQDSGLSYMEFRILRTLNDHGTLPMVKLAEMNSITQGWVTNLVDRLEQRGLAKRIRDSGDRRIIKIMSTESGNKLYCEVRTIYEKHVAQALSFMPASEKETLISLLTKIEQKLSPGQNTQETPQEQYGSK
ncbi:MarR family transcriptional regulator [Thermoplasmatales archaeon AK]|nr:MarR family transcriptional regulator [Thermoplasmatales archaeon AK]